MSKKNYWTDIAIEARKSLQSQKIYDAKKHHTRHPKLSDLTFEEAKLPQERSKEEWKELFKTMREEAKQRKESRPFSEFHNKLINNSYGRRTDYIKRSAIEAAHEHAIEQILIKRQIRNSLNAFKRDETKPNILIINKENNWNISTFMTIPSTHTLDTLYKIGMKLSEELSVSMKDFFNIEIWNRHEYMSKLAGDKRANYRYEIGKTKPKKAA